MHAIILQLFLIMYLPKAYTIGTCSCASEYHSSGSLFTVRGRFSTWNGNPTFRIWIVGTKRILGVRAGTQLPTNLQILRANFDTVIMGDFIVCPLTKPKRGVMQIVSICSTSNLRSLNSAQGNCLPFVESGVSSPESTSLLSISGCCILSKDVSFSTVYRGY